MLMLPLVQVLMVPLVSGFDGAPAPAAPAPAPCRSIQMLQSSRPPPSSTVPSHSSHRSSLASLAPSHGSGLNGHTPHHSAAWGPDKDADKAAAAAATSAAAAGDDGDDDDDNGKGAGVGGAAADLTPAGDQVAGPLRSTSSKSVASSKAGKKRVIPLRQVGPPELCRGCVVLTSIPLSYFSKIAAVESYPSL